MTDKTSITEETTRAVFIGRFQPPHNGHLEVIKRILNDVNELIIVVGSSQHSHELDNPFTSGERLLMIRAAIREAQLPEDRIWIIPVPDLHLNPLWVSHVKSYCPRFNRVYSNNSLVNTLFREAGIPVENVPMIKREQYSSTLIRKRILHHQSWEHMVPLAVAQIIKNLGGINRIQTLAKEDNIDNGK